jgi:hypothetical protein
VAASAAGGVYETTLAIGSDTVHFGHLPVSDTGGGGNYPDVVRDDFGAVSIDAIEPGNESNARLETTAPERDPRPNARKNARKKVGHLRGQIPGSERPDFDALNDQMPEVETLSGAEQFDQSTGWEDLWRIEKDGETRYRWRLRFTADRRGRPGGKITPTIRRKLRRRPGKGRHGDSRREAERLRDRAKYLAEQLRKVSELRAKGAGYTDPVDKRRNARAGDPDAQREQMPDVRELDRWVDMPDMLM